MPYYLYKLKPTTPMRFGIDKASSGLATTNFTANADTVFSAICNEWVMIHGEDMLKDLIEAAKEGEFLLSDLLPYKNVTDPEGNIEDCKIYVPKPVVYFEADKAQSESRGDSVTKKKMKKVSHIDVSKLEEYFQFIRTGVDLDFAMDPNEIYGELQTTKVALTYTKESLPYQVASIRFKKNAGLCLVVKLEEDLKEYFDDVMDSLGTTGIGGKRSSGFGKFEIEEDEIELVEGFAVYDSDKALSRMLSQEGNGYIAISSVLPSEEDMEVLNDKNSFYQLMIRKGFIYSRSYAENNLKRKQLVMIKSGAYLSGKAEGSIADTGSFGKHEVYRYGKGMYLGVRI